MKIKWTYIFFSMPGYGGHSVCLPLAQQIRSGCLSLVSSHLSVPQALEYIPIWGSMKSWSYFLDLLLYTWRPLGNFLLLFPTNGALTLSLINLKKDFINSIIKYCCAVTWRISLANVIAHGVSLLLVFSLLYTRSSVHNILQNLCPLKNNNSKSLVQYFT